MTNQSVELRSDLFYANTNETITQTYTSANSRIPILG